MGELEDVDFGADTDAIRRWLAKRATYADEGSDAAGGGKHRVDPPGTVDPRRLSVPNAQDAGQHVLEALIAPEPPVARKWPTLYKPAAKAPEAETTTDPAANAHPTPPPRMGTTPGTRSPYASTPEHEDELLRSRSTNAVFKPRLGARNAITGMVVLVAALTAVAGYAAYQERTNVAYGLVVLLAVLTIIVWAVRSTITVTELAVIRGQLELISDGGFEVIDLASPYTPVLVEGRAGHRGWRVLIERHDRPLLEIDKSMVDPYHFTAVLQRIRPELRSDGTTPAP
jgi:hypothetical protein